jgi:hypothetical protein
VKVYIIGSLTNNEIPRVANAIEEAGHPTFSDWWAGGRDADLWWMEHEKLRGRTHRQALYGHNAKHIFDYDKFHLDHSDVAVLVMPAGRSGHLELGYIIGQGKPGFILFLKEPDKWDVMHLFGTPVWSVEELIRELGSVPSSVPVRMQEDGCLGMERPGYFGDWRDRIDT